MDFDIVRVIEMEIGWLEKEIDENSDVARHNKLMDDLAELRQQLKDAK